MDNNSCIYLSLSSLLPALCFISSVIALSPLNVTGNSNLTNSVLSVDTSHASSIKMFVPTTSTSYLASSLIINSKGMGNQGKEKLRKSSRIIEILISPNDKGRENCVCVAESRCSTPIDKITKRKDTACPDNLIQCCGELIAEVKKETKNVSNTSTNSTRAIAPEVKKKTTNKAVLEKKMDLSSDTKSSPAYSTDDANESFLAGNQIVNQQLPVQIPLLKIPIVDRSGLTPAERTTQRQPPLPTQYQYPPASSYQHDKYIYTPISSRASGPNYYFRTEPPSTNKYGNTFLINHEGRGFTSDPGRSGTFLGNLASYIG